jgi:tetratricopeptide (TPR) repeat protein
MSRSSALPFRARWLSRLALAILLSLPAFARGETSAPGFDVANRLYEEGKFGEAAAAYEKLAQPGASCAALDFNLGNACFKSGQIGRAIAAYRRATQITPRDPDVRANLQFARNQVQAPTLAPNRWQRWLGRLTLNEWTILAAGAAWLWLLALAAQQWWPALRPALKGYGLSFAIVTALLSGCLAAAWYQARVIRMAVVVTGEAVVRHGPLAESQPAFTAHDGAELKVTDQKDDWFEVSGGPQKLGWIKRDQVLLLQP